MIIGAWLKFLMTPLVTEEAGFRYVLQPGASVKSFISDLTHQNIIKHPLLFSILLHIRHDSTQWKAGEYIFPKGTTPRDMMNRMVEGKGIIYHSFTIIAGWNFKQVRDALHQETELHHMLDHLKDEELMQKLGSKETHPEGQFFPDTYYYMTGATDLMVLRRAYHEMEAKFKQAWDMRDANLYFQKPYDVLIAASLVEKEAYLKQERPIIAGVLINRMKKNMLLQFDPTVIYGMGDRYKGKIHKTDLTTPTIYNTYTKKGLPPTPIAMPSIDSILAVLHPMQHNYYYFVAKGDGSHQFSTSLPDHNQAVFTAAKVASQKGFFNYEKARNIFKH